MSMRAKRAVVLCLTLCLCFAMLCLTPAKAAAETQINIVLASLNYSPVALMDLQYVNVSCSGRGYHITNVAWIDSGGNTETRQFKNDSYRFEVTYAADSGYVFAAGPTGYINNDPSGVSVSVYDGGHTAVLSKSYQAAIWAPIAIKSPSSETVEEGGWCSFVVSSMYAAEEEWWAQSPDGKVDLALKDIGATFPGLVVVGADTDGLILRNIPYEMDGWQIYCYHWNVNRISYALSGKATLTVIQDPARAAAAAAASPAPEEEPEPSPAPEGEPEPSPAPEEEPEPSPTPEVHEHAFRAEWNWDTVSHWHECEGCEEFSDKGPHEMVWTVQRAATAEQPGEELGRGSVCGYSATRELRYEDPEAGIQRGALDLHMFRLILTGLAGLFVLFVLGLVIWAVVKRHRDK